MDIQARTRSIRHAVVAAAMVVICCMVMSPVCADTSPVWFDPILLTSTDGSGSMEVVLQVTPAATSGPFEYTYWVTNSAQTVMSDFYLTCVGIPDMTSFDPNRYRVMSGARKVSAAGAVTFERGSSLVDWGNPLTGYGNARPQSIHDGTPGVKLRWGSLSEGGGLDLDDGSIGFSFTSTYMPATVASDLAGAFAIFTYNGVEYVHGPGVGPDPSMPGVPEWSTIMLALSGFGCLSGFRRRLRK